MCLLFAATYPERVSALALLAIYAKRLRSDDYPWAPTPEQREAEARQLEEHGWGEIDLTSYAPSRANDAEFKRWLGAWMRNGASPRAAAALLRMNSLIDVRDVLPTVSVPTLMLHRVGDRDVEHRGGPLHRRAYPRSATRRATRRRASDRRRRRRSAGRRDRGVPHRSVPRPSPTACSRPSSSPTSSGRPTAQSRSATAPGATCSTVTTRSCAASSSATAAARSTPPVTASSRRSTAPRAPCAARARSATVRDLGLEVRAGVHTGEVQIQGDGVAGVAVHTGARVGASRAGEVLVSRTVTDLTAGSGLVFEPRGEHELKGVLWDLAAVRGC